MVFVPMVVVTGLSSSSLSSLSLRTVIMMMMMMMIGGLGVVVDSQRSVSMSKLLAPERKLPDKYHPDKEDISCTMYFSNGTSTTITQSSMPRDGGYKGVDGGGYRGGGFWGWLNGRPDHDGTHPPGFYNGMPPPCRRPSDDGDYHYYNNDNDDPYDNEEEGGDGYAKEEEDIGGDVDNGSWGQDNNDYPLPGSSPSEARPPSSGSQVPEVQMPIPFPVPAPSTLPPTLPQVSPSITSPTPPETDNPQSSPEVAKPPPWTEEQEESEAQQQPYYTTLQTPQEEDDHYVENVIRISVSIALPPVLHRGIPKEVSKAVTKLMNITSQLRSQTMLDQFLSEYGEDSSTAHIVNTLLQLYPVDEIPYLIDQDQPLMLYMRYSDSFRRRHLDRAFFWELVDKPTKPIPVQRIVPPGPFSPTLNATTTTHLHSNSSGSSYSPQLASWFVHRISYRCYERDLDGTVVPILDPSTLSLIEAQLQQWLELHVNTTDKLMDKLHRDHALGIVLPGNEYDVELNDEHWTVRPHDSSSSSSSTGSSSSSSSDEAGLAVEDDYYWQVPPGTYTEPLVVTDTSLLETRQQQLGWILLACTLGITGVWTLIAKAHRQQQQQQALWGTTSNVGTEEALHPILNVGWSVRDAGDADDRQVLIIYDKTKHALTGYCDDDSMLQGGEGLRRPPNLGSE